MTTATHVARRDRELTSWLERYRNRADKSRTRYAAGARRTAHLILRYPAAAPEGAVDRAKAALVELAIDEARLRMVVFADEFREAGATIDDDDVERAAQAYGRKRAEREAAELLGELPPEYAPGSTSVRPFGGPR